MIKKEFELIPTQDVGYNHLLVFKSYQEMLAFDFERVKDFKWTFCSIEIKTSSLGKLAVCGVRRAQGTCYFKCNDLTHQEIVEKFLDKIEKEF